MDKKRSHKSGSAFEGTPKRKRAEKTPFPLPSKSRVPGTADYYAREVLAYKISEKRRQEQKCKVYFLVEWLNWGENGEEATWEEAANLKDSMHLVEKFLTKQGKKLVETEEGHDVIPVYNAVRL